MLENCVDLTACEDTLAELVKSVSLLSDIPLSEEDLEILANLVHQIITPNISRGTHYLRSNAPTCLACFLVGVGRFYDKETGYWPVVENKVGLIDTNWQVKWGRIFLNFIEQHKLPLFDDEEGLTYVTPILGHSGIPYCCLDEYFEQVLSPLIRRDLLNPFDRDEIFHDLKVRRRINSKRLELEHKKKEQENKLRTLRRESKRIANKVQQLEAVVSLLQKEEECESKRLALRGLEISEINRVNLLEQIQELTEKILELETRERYLQSQILAFGQREKSTIENEPQIGRVVAGSRNLMRLLTQVQTAKEDDYFELTTHWKHLSTDEWSDRFYSDLSNLPLDQISIHVEKYNNLFDNLKTIQEELDGLHNSQKELKKSPRLYSMPLTLLGKTLIWLGKHNPSSKLVSSGNSLVDAGLIGSRLKLKTYKQQAAQIERLQAQHRDTKEEMDRQQELIAGSLDNLPIKEHLLANPSIDLCEKLTNLQNVHQQFIQTCEKRCELNREYEQLVEEAGELASALSIDVNGGVKQISTFLSQAYKEAHSKQVDANRAEQVLAQNVRPTLEKLRNECSYVQENLEKLDSRLAELGEGSTQKGIELVKEYNKSRKRVATIRQYLITRYPDLPLREEEIEKRGWEEIKTDLEKDAANVEDELQAVKSKVKSLEPDLEYIPIQYPGIDEPIRRFLLFGGTSAQEFLISSVSLFARVNTGEEADQIQDSTLSHQVIERFRNWWEYQKSIEEISRYKEEETDPTTGQRFRAPQIIFDPSTVEVKVKIPTQRFLRPDQKTSVCLMVYGTDTQEPICDSYLKLYSHSKGLVETHPDEYAIPAPSESYRLILTDDEHVIHQWEIDIPGGGKHYLAFSTDTQKLIKEESLPRASLIILLKMGFTIDPQDIVLVKGGHLLGSWRDFSWCQVDLTKVKELWFIDDHDKRLALSLASYIDPSFELIGGALFEGVQSEDRPVYVTPPESIRIPVKDQGELTLMRISLLAGEEYGTRQVKHYQVDDLIYIINDHIDQGWLDIPLNAEQLLGQIPMGSYYLRIYKPPYIDWHTSFCVVPHMRVSFDKEIYLPYQGDIPNAIVTITLPQGSTFKPGKPAKIIVSFSDSCQIQVPVSENEFSGDFVSSSVDGNKYSIPLSVAIPKVRWRLQGLENSQYDRWLDKVEEEVWMGEWLNALDLFLVVETPWFFDGEAHLVLQDNSVRVENVTIRDHKARFDLKSLEDTLRVGPSLETVKISLSGDKGNIPKFPLFRIRTCWKAEKIRCFQHLEDDHVKFEITWNENGIAEQKAVRLWHLSKESPRLVHEDLVAKDRNEISFKVAANLIKTGNYLIHLEPYDPWMPRPACPSLQDRNIIVIEIEVKKQDEIVYIQSVCVDAKHRGLTKKVKYHLYRGTYKIQILGKVSNRKLPDDIDVEDIDQILVTPLNEDWYVGKLDVTGIPEVIDQLTDTNPVKFEYDPQRRIVTSIEDRHGDGAVYCYECKMLFWSQDTVIKEKKKNHRNYGPIEQFGVVWETEE